MSRAFPLAARISFALLCLLTSVYCLLAYIPDTYFAFIQAPFQAWLIWFIRLHAYLFAAALAALSTALLTEYRDGPTRRIALQFIGFFSLIAVFFLFRHPFSHVTNNSLSFVWSLAALFPVIWLGVIDRSTGSPRRCLAPVSFRVAIFAAVAIGILYPGSAWLRNLVAGRPVYFTTADYWAWVASLVAHILFAVFLVAAFNLLGSLVARVPSEQVAHFCIGLVLAIALMLVFQRVLLLSIPFAGLEAVVYSALMGTVLVLFVGGVLQRIEISPAHPSQTAKSWRDTPAAQNAAVAVLILAAIYTVPALIGIMDWNSVLAKLWAAILWLCVGIFLVHVVSTSSAMKGDLALSGPEGSRRPRYPVWLLLFLIVATYAAYRAADTYLKQPTFADALGRHATLNASYAALSDLWAVSTEKPCDSLCQFLKQQTGIPASVSVAPVDVKLVENLTPAPNPKPNIFVFVVDSLRRDYVAPYNPAVTFTPQIAQFASESVVMKNSFTRYAGTTLSEPAIWAGSLMLHKHYVQPFHPMNNLEKLLDADNYDRYVTVDTVLRLLLNSSPNLHRLDSTMTNWSDQDLCATSLEAERMLDARTDTSRPIFFYTQPQNIHVVSLERARTLRPPPPGAYLGFNPVAANEIRRIDACFGDFIRYLKAKGLYENSVVVLTADHGESYGDNGHTNHAFGLHPEVLRVPLIFHLPTAMKQYSYDADAVAFNIDITPSLYYLLGHRPIANDPRFGRPLFTLTPEEHKQYERDSYLVAVCYGPIYGILARNGNSLFVANEMEDEYQYFDLASDPGGVNNVITPTIQSQDERRIRAEVQSIADLYHYQHHHQTLLHWLMQ